MRKTRRDGEPADDNTTRACTENQYQGKDTIHSHSRPGARCGRAPAPRCRGTVGPDSVMALFVWVIKPTRTASWAPLNTFPTCKPPISYSSTRSCTLRRVPGSGEPKGGYGRQTEPGHRLRRTEGAAQQSPEPRREGSLARLKVSGCSPHQLLLHQLQPYVLDGPPDLRQRKHMGRKARSLGPREEAHTGKIRGKRRLGGERACLSCRALYVLWTSALYSGDSSVARILLAASSSWARFCCENAGFRGEHSRTQCVHRRVAPDHAQ